MKLEAGRRVYVPSTGTFGTIVRQGGIFGLSESYAIVDDLGKKQVFVGNKIEFVNVDSSETLSGEKVDIPLDVVPTIQKEHTPEEAGKMTLDLYNLCPEERSKACEEIMKSVSGKKKTSAKKTCYKKTSYKKTSKKTSDRKSRKKSS